LYLFLERETEASLERERKTAKKASSGEEDKTASAICCLVLFIYLFICVFGFLCEITGSDVIKMLGLVDGF